MKSLAGILFFLPLLLFAQETENPVRFFTHQMVHYSYDSLKTIDTTLHDFQYYDPFVNRNNFFISTGNVSSPAFNLQPASYLNTSFSSGFRHWELYRTKPEDLIYYNTFTPYTHLHYTQGDAGFQQLNAMHTRNFRPGFNVGFEIQRLTANGQYLRQRNDRNSLRLFTSYHSDNQRYMVMASGWAQNFYSQENGGVTHPASVALPEAEHTMQERNLHIKQYYFLGQDAQLVFPDDTISYLQFNPQVYISHSAHVRRSTYQFLDENPPIEYYRLLIDSVLTFDSIRFNVIENTLSVGRYSRFGTQATGIFPEAGLSHEMVNAGQFQYDTTLSSFSVFGSLELRTLPFRVKLSAKHHIFGEYFGNFSYTAELGTEAIPGWSSLVSANISRLAPGYTDNLYLSNSYIRWQQLRPIDKSQLAISAKNRNRHISASLRFINYNNYLFIDTLLNYQSWNFEENVQVVSAQAEKLFNAGRWFFRPNLLIQFSSDQTIIPLPAFAAKGSIYHQRYFYREALLGQIGINFYYFSEFEAPEYIAGLGRFSKGVYNTGDYPFTDFFFNAQINRFKIGIMLENTTRGITTLIDNIEQSPGTFEHFMLPNYLYQPMSFRLNVSWMFYD